MTRAAIRKTSKAKHTVSCANNPHDLRPAADAIIADIKEKLATLPPDQTLFVPLPECHTVVTHPALQQLVLSRTLALGREQNFRIGCSFEQENNILTRYLPKILPGAPPLPPGALEKNDPDGEKSLAVTLVHHKYKDLPLTTQNLLAFCLNNKILSRFNDVATKIVAVENSEDKYFLDQDNLETRNLIMRYAKDNLGKPIDSEDSLGVELRNKAGLEGAIAHARQAQARVYFLLYGEDHVFGHTGGNNAGKKNEYRHSLSALFKDAGAAFMPVYITLRETGISTIPAEAQDAFTQHCTMINHMDEATPRKSEEDESMKKLAVQSDGAFEVFNTRALRKNLRAKIQRQAPHWVTEAMQFPEGNPNRSIPAP